MFVKKKGQQQTCKFFSSTLPVLGHCAGGRSSMMTAGASLGRFMYCLILSTEIITFAKLHWCWTLKTWETFNERPYVITSPANPEIINQANQTKEIWQ
jgi:hypothetical protein